MAVARSFDLVHCDKMKETRRNDVFTESTSSVLPATRLRLFRDARGSFPTVFSERSTRIN